jgi:RimJ/RimL family protein N-acetyltransferase
MAIASVSLRPTTVADLPFVRAAEQAPENARYIRQWSPERHLQACHSEDERHWIVMGDQGKPVGYLIMMHLQDPDQNQHLKRLVITEKGRGYGGGALRIALARFFEDYQAHRVWLDVMTTNTRARTLYEKVGFVWEGCFRESAKTPDGFKSMDIMAILRSEYLALPVAHG